MFGKKVLATATILADEGYRYVSNGPNSSKQHETYIIEVHPEGAEPFRVEIKAWVSWPAMPKVGDTVNVWWKPGTQKVELALEGDLRFDAKLQRERQETADAARREELLSSPAGSPPSTRTAPPSEQGSKFCANCGQLHGPGDAFCPHCGHQFV